ncbi:hypothetical protein ACOSP7_024229 [Xanthoceras sorbifolium]
MSVLTPPSPKLQKKKKTMAVDHRNSTTPTQSLRTTTYLQLTSLKQSHHVLVLLGSKRGRPYMHEEWKIGVATVALP